VSQVCSYSCTVTASRKTQLYLVTCYWGRRKAVKYWSLVCMEEGNYSGELSILCGHSDAHEK